MLRNLFILLTAIVMGLFYYKFSISRSKDAQNMAFFMKITFLVLSLILAFTRKEFILIGDLAFGGRTSVMVLVLIEIADAFIDTDGSVTGDKQCKMMEDAISSNNYIIGISVEEKGVAQICHSKILRE